MLLMLRFRNSESWNYLTLPYLFRGMYIFFYKLPARTVIKREGYICTLYLDFTLSDETDNGFSFSNSSPLRKIAWHCLESRIK